MGVDREKYLEEFNYKKIGKKYVTVSHKNSLHCYIVTQKTIYCCLKI